MAEPAGAPLPAADAPAAVAPAAAPAAQVPTAAPAGAAPAGAPGPPAIEPSPAAAPETQRGAPKRAPGKPKKHKMLVHPKMLDKNGRPLAIVWDQFLGMHRFNLGLTGLAWYHNLDDEAAYPSSLSGMRVRNSRVFLNRGFIARLKLAREEGYEHAQNTQALEWYLSTLLRILEPLRGKGAGFTDPEDDRIKDMLAALAELQQWHESFADAKARAAGFIPLQLFADLKQAVHGFIEVLTLIKRICAREGWTMEPVNPKVFMQDRTEGLFGQLRAFVGGGGLTVASFLDALLALEVRQGKDIKAMSRATARRTNVGKEDAMDEDSDSSDEEVVDDAALVALLRSLGGREEQQADAGAPAPAAGGSANDDDDDQSSEAESEEESDMDSVLAAADDDEEVYGAASDED